MKCVQLIRTDASSNDITLSLGEAVIGRGSVFQCKDPRVSRKHGFLKTSERDAVTLVPTHSNPCFYKKGADRSVCIIRKGSEVTLEIGDEFALLPDRFWFRINVVQNETGMSVPVEDNVNVEPTEADVTLSLTEEDIDDGVLNNNDTKDDTAVSEEKDSSNELNISRNNLNTASTSKQNNMDISVGVPVTQSTPKKQRVLPLWMTSSSKESLTTQEKGKSKKDVQKTTNDTDTKSNEEETGGAVTTKRGRPKKTQSSNSAVKCSSPRKNALNTSAEKDDEEEPAITNVAKNDVTPSTHDMSDDEEENQPNTSNAPSPSKRNTKITPPVNVPVTTPPSATASVSSISRKLCIYGRDCFRKNPDHKKEFCHPSDPDYVQIYRSLPECEYGKACYRKNREHRASYRHDGRKNKGNTPTKNSPRKAKRNAAGNTRRAAAASSEEDDYDYDDPFLYDGSSDDYLPTDSDASTDSDWISDGDSEPDLKRMKKERKKFVRRK